MNLETVQDLRARHERETAEVCRTLGDLVAHALRQATELLACAQGWQERAKELERDAALWRVIEKTIYRSSDMPVDHWCIPNSIKGGESLRAVLTDAAKEQS